jgi:RHS repeat-associated protein
MKARTHFSGFILFVSILLPAFLPAQVHAIDTTLNGVTVTWEASPLSDITRSSVYGGDNFYFQSASFSDKGDILDVTITLPKEYVQNSQWCNRIALYLPNVYGAVAETGCVWGGDPKAADLVLTAHIPVNVTTNIYFEALDFDVMTDIAGSSRGMFVHLGAAKELQVSIEFNPDKLGGPDDNPNDAFDPGDGPGCPGQQGLPNYSVNTSILNLVVQDTDYLSAGPGPQIAATRSWNTTPSHRGMFGNGWSFPYESTLKTNCYGATLNKGSGQAVHYSASLCPAGSVTLPASATPPTGVLDKLTLMPGNYWLWEEKETKWLYRYDLAGTDAQGTSTYRLTTITDRNGNAAGLTYNVTGSVATITDAGGRAASFAYDVNKHCTAMTTPDGKTATYSYDAGGNLKQSVDLLGTVISYTYDANNYMTSMKVGDKTTTFAYDLSGGWKHIASITDANGNTKSYGVTSRIVTTMTDSRGRTTSYNGDFYGRIESIVDPANITTAWTYTADGLPATAKDGNGKITTMEYDARGNLTKKTDPLGNVTTSAYDANDNILTRTNPLNQTWTYAYDGNGNHVKTTSPMGRQSANAYDAKGRLTGATDENGNTTTYTYDTFGNVKTVKDPLGNITTYGYDAFGMNRTSRTDAGGATTLYSYDNNRRLTKETHPDGTYRTYSHDACAMVASTDENGKRTALTRDKLLNITGITDPLGKITAKEYDGNNNLISLTDALNHAYINTYDPANRLTKTANPAGKTVVNGYDGAGNLTSLKDERVNTTVFGYDANNLLLTTTDPLANLVTQTRDKLGRITQLTNARGEAVGFTYDADGRMTQKSYGATVVAAYGYDAAGNQTTVTDALGVTTYSFDPLNRVTGIRYPDKTAVSFTYDKAGSIGSITYPGALVASYSHDNRDRVQSVTWDTHSVTFGYDGAGNPLSNARSNGATSTYTYDGNNRVTGIDHKKGAASFAQMNYTRDAVGNTVSETARLPVSPRAIGATTDAGYNAANQVTAWGTDTYVYDMDGNLTAATGGKTVTAAYDRQNRPTTLTINGATATCTYDGSGNRARVVTGSRTRNYHYDHTGRLLYETDGSGTVVASYLYADERLVALKEGGASYFYHFDKTGNTVAVTTAAGAVVNAYAYTPFGVLSGSSGSLYNPFTYVGEYGVMSEGNNIYFMKNRYYDAITGRFIQKDPIGRAGGQPNLYAYVGDNPVERRDPVGLGDIMGGTYDINNIKCPINMSDNTMSDQESEFVGFLGRTVANFSPLGNAVNVGQLAYSLYQALYNNGSKQEVAKNLVAMVPLIGNYFSSFTDAVETWTGKSIRIDLNVTPKLLTQERLMR